MKKLFLTSVFGIAILASFAYNSNTRLVISGAASNNYKIFIDGYNVSNKYRNGNTFIIDDISTSNHRVQILKQRTSIFGVNEDKVIYDQNLYFKASTQTNLTLTLFGTVEINETPIYGNGGGWNDNNNDQPQCGNDNGRGKKNGHRKHNKKKKYGCNDRRTINNYWDN